ncbi:MAG: glycogen-binding domain-containing protein, partial [Bacteroidota bacterium]|nr:glycogen-binding domain-containing protein [Bacteroidota bacterium]
MEIKRTISMLNRLVRFIWFALLFVLPSLLWAQKPITNYTVSNGKMYIEITKDIKEAALDSFIVQFNLQDLYLKEFIKRNVADSLKKRGWKVEKNNETGFIISKPFAPFETINNPADRIIFAEKHPTFAERFPATNNGIIYGYNRFRNKSSFITDDKSVVTFYLRNHSRATGVMLAGSFNDWNPDALAMQKTDSGWIAPVKLGPGKYWYKFIVDGRWIVDEDNLLRENDGLGNINSIFYRTNTVFFLSGYTEAKDVSLAGSFNQWRPRDLSMNRTTNGWVLPLYLSEGTHAYKFVVDGRWIRDERNPHKLPDGKGDFNSFIALGKPYLFQLKGYKNAKEVRLAGSFNQWRDFELIMNKTGNGWALSYVLGPGNYEYQFLVDGARVTDPANPPAVNNGNSILIIQPNYTFLLKGYNTAEKVFLAGDFNN